jgi:hypothetical protein
MNKPRRLLQILAICGTATALQLFGLPALLAATVAAAEPWLHVKVVESGDDAETVRINLPLSLVQAMIPLMDAAGTEEGDDEADAARTGAAVDRESRSKHHHGSLRIKHYDMSPAEMRALLEAIRRAEDGEYVAVDGVDEKVRVNKSGGYFVIDVDDHGEDHEQVKVRMSLAVLDALLSGGTDELNLEAAARELRNHSGEDLVSVVSDDETVRIWIDDSKSSD